MAAQGQRLFVPIVMIIIIKKEREVVDWKAEQFLQQF